MNDVNPAGRRFFGSTARRKFVEPAPAFMDTVTVTTETLEDEDLCKYHKQPLERRTALSSFYDEPVMAATICQKCDSDELVEVFA